jgi:hypothetical protein
MSEVATLSPTPVAAPAATLVSAIAAVMNEIHVVAKRGENEFHRYRYATMGDILKEITPLLGRHGIVIFQSETGRAMFDDDNVIAIEYAFTVAHASGETWPHTIKQTGVSTCRNSKGGWDDKSLNKCHTAARKYFLLALFQIPTGEEADADQGENDHRLVAIPSAPSTGERFATRPARTTVPARIQRNLDRLNPKPGGIAERAISQRYEQAVRSVGPSQPFPASEAGKAFSPRFRAQAAGYDERNPPADDVIPDGPGEAARALNARLHPFNDGLPGDLGRPKVDTSERDGVPAFLGRRKANGNADDAAEPSYLDLVGGGR